MKAKKLVLFVLMFVLAFGLFACSLGKVSVTLSGDNSVEVGKSITLTAEASKSGASFAWSSSDNSVATVQGGTVTGVKEGKVIITVVAEVGSKSAEATIEITVIKSSSNHSPVISGVKDIEVEKGTTPNLLEGVTAWDEEDGDLTKKINVKSTFRNAVGEYDITYSVTDKDGNTTTVKAKIRVVATDKKEPLLTGVANKTIIVGDTTFKTTDNVNAIDDNDGDITGNIVVTGTVDPWKVGDYEVKYSVKDAAGNEAKATRTITVSASQFQFTEMEEPEFDDENKMTVSLGDFASDICSFALARLQLKVTPSAACDLVATLTNGVTQEKYALTAEENELTIYFRVSAKFDDGELKLTVPAGVTLTIAEVKFAFGEALDSTAPRIDVPADVTPLLPGTFTDKKELAKFVLSDVSATDDIDGIVTSKLGVDFGDIDLGNCFEEKEVTIFCEDNAGNRAEVKRTVKFVKVYDTKIIKDPEFNTDVEPYDAETHIGWGLNGGSGDPELNVINGELVHHNRSTANPGWDSASSPFYRTTTAILKPYNWYMLKFDVKAEVARPMTVRIGLETTEALGWIENFTGANNTPFNITTEYQTCYVVFYVHAEKSQAGMDVAKIELKVGSFNWGANEQGNTVYFDNLQLYLLSNENNAPELTVNTDLPTTFGKGEDKPDLTKYVTAYDLEDAGNIEVTAAHITEAIDMSKAGTYDVVYKVADSEGKESTVTIKIKVLEEKDTAAPVLAEAAGIKKVYDQFEDAPDLTKLITATDVVDGDIAITKAMIETDADITKAGTYEVKYTVKDSSGNKAELTITLTVNDKEGPAVTGKDILKTNEGKALTAEAIIKDLAVVDNVDGEITLTAANVKDLDKVDFNKAGEYKVVVEVSDAAGNKTSFEMTIVVRPAGAKKTVINEKAIDLTALTVEKAEECTVTEENGEYKVVITSLGQWASANKMKFAGLDLKSGETYALKLIAKANEARQVKMNLGIGLWADPWMDYFTLIQDSAAEIVLDTEYKEYVIFFTYDKENRDGGPSLEFCVGPTGNAGDKVGNDIFIKELAIYSTKEEADEIATEVHDFLQDELKGENATVAITDGVLTINPTDAGGWASFAKIKLTGLPVEAGKTYEMRITAKAEEARQLQFNIGIGLWADPWMDYFTLADPDTKMALLSTEYQEFVIRFTVDKDTRDSGPSMEFCAGNTGHAGDKKDNVISVSQFKLFEIEKAAAPKANVNLLADLPTTNADYLSDKWTREKYGTDGWVTPGSDMRSREKDGIRVVNMANGYGMVYRFTYNKDGASLGLANKLSFKAGNYWTDAEAMDVKVLVTDIDDNNIYLVGTADEFYSFAATTGLLDFSFDFDEVEIVSVTIVTKSTKQNYTYLYVGNLMLTYGEGEEQPVDEVAPIITVDEGIQAVVAAGLNFQAGNDLSQTFARLRAGLSATDDVDGAIAITDEMIDLGGLNLTKAYAGKFTVVVTVKDKAGNAAKLELPVTVTGDNGLILDILHRGLKGENATVEMVEDVAQIDPTNIGEWASFAKMKITNLGLEPGKTYKLKINAKADEARKIQFNIGIGLWADPWMNKFTLAEANSNILALTTEYADYEIKFVFDKKSVDGGPTIEFCVGKVGSDGDKVGNKIYVKSLDIYEVAESEAMPLAPAVITVPEEKVQVPGVLTDANAFKKAVLKGVTAKDELYGDVSDKVDVDMADITLGVLSGELEVTVFIGEGDDRAEATRTVKFLEAKDTEIIADPTFATDITLFSQENTTGWGLNGGSGSPELKVVDGALVHHNTTNDHPGWDSASSPFFRTTTEVLEPYKWYLLKFDVKAEVARKMTIRAGLETTEVLGWIENFEGANNVPVSITTEWQTVYVVFYVHSDKSEGGYPLVKIEFKVGTFDWGNNERGNTVYFDNMQIYEFEYEKPEVKKADENLLADLPTSDADYTSTKWTREKYTTEWVSGGTTRSRGREGIRVMNIANGKGMTYRLTYNKGGESLGLANTLSFKAGNYWSNAEVVQVKVILVDKDGQQTYLVGSSDAFYDFPVTTGLVSSKLTFDEKEIVSVVIVTKSANQGDTFFYIGDLLLTYEEAEEQPQA